MACDRHFGRRRRPSGRRRGPGAGVDGNGAASSRRLPGRTAGRAGRWSALVVAAGVVDLGVNSRHLPPPSGNGPVRPKPPDTIPAGVTRPRRRQSQPGTQGPTRRRRDPQTAASGGQPAKGPGGRRPVSAATAAHEAAVPVQWEPDDHLGDMPTGTDLVDADVAVVGQPGDLGTRPPAWRPIETRQQSREKTVRQQLFDHATASSRYR